MKTILLSLTVLFCSLCSYASADVKDTVTIEKYGKTFDLTAPDGFCFLSNNPLLEDLYKYWYDYANRANDGGKIISVEHLAFAWLCEDLNQWLGGAPLNPKMNINFALEISQNKKLELGLIKKPSSTKKYLSGMWETMGDKRMLDQVYELGQDLIKKDGYEIVMTPIHKIYKGKKCVYTAQSFGIPNVGVFSALSATCWINDRSVSTYLYKNNEFFESAAEIQEALDILKEFNNSIN